MKKRMTILAGLAAVLLSAAGVGSAYAYFTTYSAAQGGHVLSLGDRTEITEEFDSWTKRVVITSDEDSEPVYIRARAYGPAAYPLDYSGEGWIKGGGEDEWWYYTGIVPGGGKTSELDVHIQVPEKEALKDGDSFHVVVVYESAPVRYEPDGTPYEANDPRIWEAVLESYEWEGGGN